MRQFVGSYYEYGGGGGWGVKWHPQKNSNKRETKQSVFALQKKTISIVSVIFAEFN